MTMRVLLIMGLWAMGGCADDAAPAADGASDAATVANALTQNLSFEGGEILSGDLPAADDESVLLLPLIDTVLMSPGQATLMPLNLFNPNADDPVVATLMQFGAAPDHIRVPVPGRSGSAGDVDNPAQLADDACEGLCARAYAVKVTEVLELDSGKIGKHVERTVLLDCRDDPKAVACDGDAAATPDASVNQPLDGSLPVAERVRMGLLDAVKAVCACETALRPVGLVCAGTLAEANAGCHAAALQDYAGSSGADLRCAIDGAESAPACLAGCDPATGPACLTELTGCGVDLAEVERALLSCETFACADSASRIEGSRLCDGNPDCGDGSDEASPTCDGANGSVPAP